MTDYDRSIDEFHKAALDDFASMSRAGQTIAIPAALSHCAEHGVSAPAGLLTDAADLLNITLKNNFHKNLGARNRAMLAYRQDMIDYWRWDEICVIREQQKNLGVEIERLRALPKATGELLKRQKKLIHERVHMLKEIGHTVDDAFQYASKRFKNTEASGGWDTMRRSYRAVTKGLKDPKQATRYYIFDPRFLRKLGIELPLAN